MNDPHTYSFTWHGLAVGSAMLLAAALGTSAATGQERNKDQKTCATMGAPYGSPGYTQCMLRQQKRGDEKMLNFLAEQRMHQELGRPAREKLAEKRARREWEKPCPR